MIKGMDFSAYLIIHMMDDGEFEILHEKFLYTTTSDFKIEDAASECVNHILEKASLKVGVQMAWVTGHVHFGTDHHYEYGPEDYEELHPLDFFVREANEEELASVYMTEEDKMITAFMETDPEVQAELAKPKSRYDTFSLRQMAEAKMKGCVVNFKTGDISIQKQQAFPSFPTTTTQEFNHD